MAKLHEKRGGMGEHKKGRDYPDQTAGSKLAAKVREKANKLSDGQRTDSLQRGLAMIYGAGSKKTVSARH